MKKFFKYLFLLILAFLVSFGLYYVVKTYFIHNTVDNLNNKEEKIEEEKKEEVYPKISKISMVTTGDALIHSPVFTDAKTIDGTYDFSNQLTYIKPIISDYDLAFYNQETIIGGKDRGLSGYPLFNSPDEIGDNMIDMGFNMVNLASNHSLDQGEAGILHSLGYWKSKENVLAAGSYESEEDRTTPRIKEVNGIKYTLLAYTTSTNGINHPNGKTYYDVMYSDELVKEDIERVKDLVDVIFVSMHWGVEYSHDASEEQKRIAKYLASLGVNVVIGTHPHVLEPIEKIDDTLVIYSLGNFLSSQIGVERLTGALISFNITKEEDKDGNIKINVSDETAELIYTYYNSVTRRGFKVIPYSNLDDNMLPNYKSYYDKFSSILKKYDENLIVKPLE